MVHVHSIQDIHSNLATCSYGLGLAMQSQQNAAGSQQIAATLLRAAEQQERMASIASEPTRSELLKEAAAQRAQAEAILSPQQVVYPAGAPPAAETLSAPTAARTSHAASGAAVPCLRVLDDDPISYLSSYRLSYPIPPYPIPSHPILSLLEAQRLTNNMS